MQGGRLEEGRTERRHLKDTRGHGNENIRQNQTLQHHKKSIIINHDRRVGLETTQVLNTQK